MKQVILKKGKEAPLLRKHHWVFSGAIASMPSSFEEGEVLEVVAFDETILGRGYFFSHGSLVGHMLSFGKETVEQALERNIQNSIILREKLFLENTNAYRVIHAEGDGIPGLIVDKYDDCLVLQIANRGIERLKPLLITLLKKYLSVKTIVEKSTSSLRQKEQFEEKKEVLFGSLKKEYLIHENSMKFLVDLFEGQKTGLFFDQREMRLFVERLSHGKKVLNCFCYTGGFSLFAKRGGATLVDSVDSSAKSLENMKKNIELNFGKDFQGTLFCEDVFSFLEKKPLNYDLVILDPPAFAKKREDEVAAFQGYKRLNALALKKMPKRSLLLTFSCSSYINEETFQRILFQASLETNRTVKILSKQKQAFDHPVSIYHPESLYLKGFLLYVE